MTEAAVGSATGMLAAVFCAAQLVTSYPWGMISDRVGRKVGARFQGGVALGWLFGWCGCGWCG